MVDERQQSQQPTATPQSPGDRPSRIGPRGREACLLLVLLLYAAVVWTWGVGRADIIGSMEARRAVGTRGMLRTGDFVIPRVGTDVYLAKPPLFYWAAAGLSAVSGEVTAASVRSVSGLSAVAVLLVLYLALRPVLGRRRAWMACLVFLTTPLVFEQASIAMVNMLLTLGVSIALFSAFYLLEARKRTWRPAALCGVGLAMGLLTKGPVILMFFVPTLLLYAGFLHRDRLTESGRRTALLLSGVAALLWLGTLAANRSHFGTLLFVVPAALLLFFGLRGGVPPGSVRLWVPVLAVAATLTIPWPILVTRQLASDVLWRVSHEELWLGRVTSVGHTNSGPLWFYLLTFPPSAGLHAFFLPLAFLPGATQANGREGRLLLLAKCWLVGSLVLFSTSTTAKETRYIVPALPALAILVGDVLHRIANGSLSPRLERYARASGIAAMGILCVLPVVAATAWTVLGLDWGWRPGLMVAILACAAAAAVVPSRRGRQPTVWLTGLTLAMLGVTIFVNFGMSEVQNRRRSCRQHVQQLRQLVPAGEPLHFLGKLRASLLFYLDPLPLETAHTDNATASPKASCFICIETGPNKPTPELPSGYVPTELGSLTYRRSRIAVLRLDPTRPEDPTPPPSVPTLNEDT